MLFLVLNGRQANEHMDATHIGKIDYRHFYRSNLIYCNRTKKKLNMKNAKSHIFETYLIDTSLQDKRLVINRYSLGDGQKHSHIIHFHFHITFMYRMAYREKERDTVKLIIIKKLLHEYYTHVWSINNIMHSTTTKIILHATTQLRLSHLILCLFISFHSMFCNFFFLILFCCCSLLFLYTWPLHFNSEVQ